MSTWIVVRCLGRGAPAITLPKPVGGNFVCSREDNTEVEEAALRESALSFDEALQAPILGTQVLGAFTTLTRGAALQAASRSMEESLDLVRLGGMFRYRYRLMEAGFTRDLSTGSVEPILEQRRLFETHPFFEVAHPFSPIGLEQRLHFNRHVPLVERIIRAAHWQRRANGSSGAFGIPLLWFGLEALWKLRTDRKKERKDHSICAEVRWALGYPPRGRHRDLPIGIRTPLEGSQWVVKEPRIIKLVDHINRLRGDTVHGGLTPVSTAAADAELMRLVADDALTNSIQMATIGVNELGCREPSDLVREITAVFKLFLESRTTIASCLGRVDQHLERARVMGVVSVW